MTLARPFLKWAGGKTQLLSPIEALLPKSIRTYYEPFIGGGALFFHLASRHVVERAVIADYNSELITCYKVVRDFVGELIEELQVHTVDKDHFLEVRSQHPDTLTPIQRAARTIYLNKTGFNGLYRVNKRGQFNVPYGSYKNPRILDEANLRACAEVLNRYAVIHAKDFSQTVKTATEGDVVYFDPPYVPITPTSNFLGYTSGGFTLDDQKRLAVCFENLVRRGVAVIASNSDTSVVRDLYGAYEMHVVQARRNINSKGSKRGPVGELLIVGRPAKVPGYIG